MKNNLMTTILNVLLGLALVFAMIFCVQFVVITHEARKLGAEMAAINVYNNSIRSLAADCVKYGESNPAILPILQTVGIGKPAGK